MSIRSRMWEKHEVNLGPVVRRALSVALLLTLSLWLSLGTARRSTGASASPWPGGQLIAPEAAAQGSAPLRVMVGKSLLINTTERLTPGLRNR